MTSNLKIAILCVDESSNYYQLSKKYNLDIYSASRSMLLFNDSCPVICHPPCAQWSRLKNFAHVNDELKKLAPLCYDIVNSNGGILEHPSGTSLFKTVKADTNKILSVDQHWWNFPARKRTYLYFHKVKPISFPLNLNAYPGKVSLNIPTQMRSRGTIEFNEWLINNIIASFNKS